MNNDIIFSLLFNDAQKGSCMFRKYAAAVVKNGKILGHGYATTVDGNKCIDCPREEKFQQYGEISEFFEVCPVIHAEVCAVLDCGNIKAVRDSDLFLLGLQCPDNSIYNSAFPCNNCLRFLMYTGIRRIVVFQDNLTTIMYEVQYGS